MDRQALRADCSRCAALCCTVLGFAKSARFAIDKPVGAPCPHLLPDLRCDIHSELRQRGFAGCVEYDCFGAGQRVTGQLFPGRDWRSEPGVAGDMGAALLIMEQLHALLWYLADAADALRPGVSGRPAGAADSGDEGLADRRARSAGVVADLRARVVEATNAVQELAAGSAEVVVALPVEKVQSAVDLLLDEVSAVVRTRLADRRGGGAHEENPGIEIAPVRDVRRAKPRSANVRGVDLSGADLRGADLSGADLSGVDLSGTDLRGADLSGTDLRGARLTGALYLTAGQVRSARGDRHTVLPGHLDRPAHWLAERPSRPG